MKKSILFLFLFFLIGLVQAESILSDVQFESSSIIKVSIKEGEVINQPIVFFNSGQSRKFNFNRIDNFGFFEVGEKELIVEKDNFASVDVFLGNSNLKKGIYFGKIDIIESDDFFSIPVLLIVNSKAKLFGSSIRISQNSLVVSDSLNTDITFFNLKSILPSAFIEYKIVDLEGNIILEQSEILEIKREVTISKEFKIPDNAEEGAKYLIVSIKQGDSFYLSSETFDISKKSRTQPIVEKDFSSLISLGVVVFLLFSVIVISYFWNRRILIEAKDWRKQINKVKKTKFGDSAKYLRKLIHQKNILERAYGLKYISKKSYVEGTKEINLLIKKTKKKL